MVASNEYHQTASDVNTPAGDISVDAKNIIVEVHILAHREHRFWPTVNTHSGRA
ncbi:hypothetical protein [Endozoicomonas sp. ALB115]|uniref:hypothetical protein n=1 Tax=Endozoicomonas sp. ALB115 TaxID=3403074 RepID=UPI003BB70037